MPDGFVSHISIAVAPNCLSSYREWSGRSLPKVITCSFGRVLSQDGHCVMKTDCAPKDSHVMQPRLPDCAHLRACTGQHAAAWLHTEASAAYWFVCRARVPARTSFGPRGRADGDVPFVDASCDGRALSFRVRRYETAARRKIGCTDNGMSLSVVDLARS